LIPEIHRPPQSPARSRNARHAPASARRSPAKFQCNKVVLHRWLAPEKHFRHQTAADSVSSPGLVQHSATVKVRNGARFGRFVSFRQTAIIAFIHAALVRVFVSVAQVPLRISNPRIRVQFAAGAPSQYERSFLSLVDNAAGKREIVLP